MGLLRRKPSRTDLAISLLISKPTRTGGGYRTSFFHDDEAEGVIGAQSITYKLAGVRTFFLTLGLGYEYES
jgi:hypothetical protein